MTTRGHNIFWAGTVILLVIIIVAGAITIGLRYTPSPPVEVMLSPDWELPEGRIIIEGAVSAPGIYPLNAGDSLASLLRSAGGTTANADLNGFKLYVPQTDEPPGPQKIDINRAEAWLLEALPGIGETLAQRIIDYREQNGPFMATSELTRVAGISASAYEKIKDLVTVGD